MNSLLTDIDIDKIASFVSARMHLPSESVSPRCANSRIRSEHQSMCLKELTTRKNEGKVFGCALVDSSGLIIGAAVVDFSDWDTAHFGLGIGKLKIASFEKHVNALNRRKVFKTLKDTAPSHHVDLIISRVPSGDPLTIHSLENNGAVITDVLLTFCVDLNNACLPTGNRNFEKPGLEFSKANKADEDALTSIAKNVFEIDHFHADSRLDQKRCDVLYAKWISNSLNGLADAVFVAKRSNDVLGFVTCKLNAESSSCTIGSIDLIGVRNGCKGKGIGSFLVFNALNWFSDYTDKVKVGTQAANVPAVHLYKKMGFRLLTSETTLHTWAT